MIVLTGTTGGLGSGVLATILEQKLLLPSDICISTYSPTSARLAAARAAGIEIRHGDMTKPETLEQSYKGADALFLVSYPSVGEERFALHRSAIDAAKTAGVKHVLYTSLTFGGVLGEESHAGVMQAHIKTVQYLKQSGLEWTIIREPTYAHLWNNFAGFLNLEAAPKLLDIVISNDGPNHWASREDLAEGTAKIVAKWVSEVHITYVSTAKLIQADYAGQTLNLTGAATHSVRDIVSLYCQRTRRQFTIHEVGETRAVEHHIAQGSLPLDMQDFLPNWASWGEAMARKEVGYTDILLERLLGRRPKTIEEMQDELFKAETNALDIKDFV